MTKKLFWVILLALIFNACMTTKEYQRININDPDMVLSDRLVDRNIATFQSYREAAAGANGGKTGGGCGCN
jgi:hypothetical protein